MMLVLWGIDLITLSTIPWSWQVETHPTRSEVADTALRVQDGLSRFKILALL